MSAPVTWQVRTALYMDAGKTDPKASTLHRAFHHHTCAAVDTLIAGIKAQGPGKPVDMCDVLQVGRTL